MVSSKEIGRNIICGKTAASPRFPWWECGGRGEREKILPALIRPRNEDSWHLILSVMPIGVAGASDSCYILVAGSPSGSLGIQKYSRTESLGIGRLVSPISMKLGDVRGIFGLSFPTCEMGTFILISVESG